jgi:hypothetical protein
MQINNLPDFLISIKREDGSVESLALGLVWYELSRNRCSDLTTDEIANKLIVAGLRGHKNIAALRHVLKKSKKCYCKNDRWRLKATCYKELGDKYEGSLKPLVLPIAYRFTPKISIEGRLAAIGDLNDQLNGCFNHGYYSAAAAMLRKIIEDLLFYIIYTKMGADYVKKKNSNADKSLNELIGIVEGGGTVRVSKEALTAMKRIRELGNVGVHHKTYRVKEMDLTTIDLGVRICIEELCSLATADDKEIKTTVNVVE